MINLPTADLPLIISRTHEYRLACPFCHYTYTHHGTIDVWDRSEDAKTGLHTTLNNSAVHTESAMTGNNPSPRRDGLTIQLWCEGCDAHYLLSIYQHKGETFIYFTQ